MGSTSRQQHTEVLTLLHAWAAQINEAPIPDTLSLEALLARWDAESRSGRRSASAETVTEVSQRFPARSPCGTTAWAPGDHSAAPSRLTG